MQEKLVLRPIIYHSVIVVGTRTPARSFSLCSHLPTGAGAPEEMGNALRVGPSEADHRQTAAKSQQPSAAGTQAWSQVHAPLVTRYGFAIKALPKGGKPFGDDDEDQAQDDLAADGADTCAPPDEDTPSAEAASSPGRDEPAPEASVDDETATAEPSDEEAPIDGAAPDGQAAADPVPGPEDDSRPWSGDMYDEGDETSPSAAFAAYQGAEGEEAWLDQAPDGTLTGWVRDATGQVWRYTDPDVWAIDVDDAQMTRTHSQANSGGDASADHGGQDPLFPPKQS